MADGPDLAALVGSRICHDLISPLGAIGNGVELLGMTTAATTPELALIAESVAAANARIKFYRVAFGAASADQRIGRPELLSILGDLSRGARVAIDWLASGDPARPEAKLAFLAIQCLETALPYGGRITVTLDAGTWTLVGAAPRLKVELALWAALTDPVAGMALTPAQVQFALLPQEARTHGRALRSEIGPEEIRIGF